VLVPWVYSLLTPPSSVVPLGSISSMMSNSVLTSALPSAPFQSTSTLPIPWSRSSL
jgi:hypothetical protein